MLLPSNPQTSDTEEAKAEDKFSFGDESLEEEHVKLRKRIAVQKRREARLLTSLDKNIRSTAERDQLNLRASDRQLMKAQVENSLEDLRKTKDAKNEALEKISELLQGIVDSETPKDREEQIDRAIEALEEEKEKNYDEYRSTVKKAWEEQGRYSHKQVT